MLDYVHVYPNILHIEIRFDDFNVILNIDK